MRLPGMLVVILWGAAATGCGDNHAAPDAVATDGAVASDAPADASTDADPLRPATLAGTGLCADDACTRINEGIFEYEPRWPLWSDGATKRRWIWLPPGTTIDTTTDPDYWRFPVGTKMWKEFSQDGAKVETRYIVNTGAGVQPWYYIAYQWNLDGTSTMAVPEGVMGANGTIHDIPSQHQCATCHENTPSKVLGFGALELDYPRPNSGLLDLDSVNTIGWLDRAPPGPVGAPHYPIPAGTGVEEPALGYLHANCGHCHNPHSAVHDVTPIELRWLIADLGAFSNSAVYRTTFNATVLAGMVNGDSIVIVPGDPAHSVLLDRMESTSGSRMPQLGSNVVDPTGVAAIQAWISSLP